MSVKFISTPDSDMFDTTNPAIEISIPDHASTNDMLMAFGKFLKAQGYVLPQFTTIRLIEVSEDNEDVREVYESDIF